MAETSTSVLSSEAQNLTWLVESFCQRAQGVHHAFVVSSDGIPMIVSAGVDRPLAERFAAVASGFVGLAAGISAPLRAGRVAQIVIEMERVFVLVTGISDGSCLAVSADTEADIGLVGYEMATLVDQCGKALTPKLRSELKLAYQR